MTRCTMTAEVETFFTFPGLAAGEKEVAYPTLSITFDYSPGHRAYTPRGEYGPIDPPDPAEVSFVEAKLIDGDGLGPTHQQVQEWASDYLDTDAGFTEACDCAEAARLPDPDEAYERQRDEL